MEPSTDRILQTLDALLQKNDYPGANEFLLSSLDAARAAKNDAHILLLYNELMGLCRKLGEQEQALSFAACALGQIEKMKIVNNVGAATTYLNCATVYKAFGKAEEAIPLFEQAHRIYDSTLSPTDVRMAGLCNNMALALVDLGRFRQAHELYRRALNVLQRNFGKQAEQAITLLNMATALETEHGAEDGWEQIDALLRQAMTLLDECPKQDSGEYAFACEKCATVFGYYGYFVYEKELKERCRRVYEGS